MIREEKLAKGLQPIRQFVLAQALYTFLDLDIWTVIATSSEGTQIQRLAHKLRLNEDRLRGLLDYLAVEGYIFFRSADTVSLTNDGRSLQELKPWYDLLVGGYSETFANLSDSLQVNAPYARRNGQKVGQGSCGISQHDALPMTQKLLMSIEGRFETIVDIGCGDGSYLLDLCELMPNVNGIGFDPDGSSVEAARQVLAARGLNSRVLFNVGRATELPDLSTAGGPLCFMTAFVLQEVLEQSGRKALSLLLSSVFAKYPDAYWVVVEVDHQPQNERIMTSPLGLAYYNPYYLIHQFTEQKLQPIAMWLELFEEVGLEVLATEHPDSAYDPLELKTAFLLRRRAQETD